MILVALVAAPAISQALGYYDAASDLYAQDFMAFYTGGLLLNQGRASDLYDGSTQKAEQMRLGASEEYLLPYFYPPAYAWLMKPWATLPYTIAFVLWRAMSLVCLLLSLSLICRALPYPLTRETLLVATAYPPVFFNLFSGQNAVLFLLVYALALYLIINKRDFVAGLILGLGSLKPQLFWLLPLTAIAQRRWKLLVGIALTSGALGLFSVFLVGLEGMRGYIAFFSTQFYRLPASVLAGKMQSLPQFIRAIVHGRVGQFTIAGLTAVPITMLSWRAVRANRSPEELFLISIPGAILGAPQAFNYDLVLLVLPALILCRRLLRTGETPQVRVVLAALFCMPLLTWLPFQPNVPVLLAFFLMMVS